MPVQFINETRTEMTGSNQITPGVIADLFEAARMADWQEIEVLCSTLDLSSGVEVYEGPCCIG